MVNHLRHDGTAGTLNATGWVDISQGAAWQLEADMNSLNLGAFIQSLDTDLNGYNSVCRQLARVSSSH